MARYTARVADPLEIIVVCYGNICRSPMGEVLLQRALDERFGQSRVLVTSAGIGADDGRPPSRGTVLAMEARGFDVRPLRSTYLRPHDVARAWRIYCMEDYQVRHVAGLADDGGAKAMLLAGEEVPDPLGSGQEAYENVALQIERLLPAVIDDIARGLA